MQKFKRKRAKYFAKIATQPAYLLPPLRRTRIWPHLQLIKVIFNKLLLNNFYPNGISNHFLKISFNETIKSLYAVHSLICQVLYRKVEGLNLATAKNLFQFKSTKISSRKSEQKKQGPLRAVAVRKEEETRRKREGM